MCRKHSREKRERKKLERRRHLIEEDEQARQDAIRYQRISDENALAAKKSKKRHRDTHDEHAKQTKRRRLSPEIQNEASDPSPGHLEVDTGGLSVSIGALELAALLQKVPQEIYDAIYELTLTPTRADRSKNHAITADYRPPVLLQVNRASRARFAKIYYRNARFFCHSDLPPSCTMESMFVRWLKSLSVPHRGMIRTFVRSIHPRQSLTEHISSIWLRSYKMMLVELGYHALLPADLSRLQLFTKGRLFRPEREGSRYTSSLMWPTGQELDMLERCRKGRRKDPLPKAMTMYEIVSQQGGCGSGFCGMTDSVYRDGQQVKPLLE